MFENIRKKSPLGMELIKKGIATQEAIDKALQYQQQHPTLKIGEILDLLKLCDQTALLDALAEKLEEKPVFLGKTLTFDYLQYLPRDVIIRCKAIPFEVEGNRVRVAFSDPTNTKIVEEVNLILLNKGYTMEKYVTLYTQVMRIVEGVEEVDVTYINRTEQDTTVLVDNIIKTAIDKRASDVHFEPMEDQLRIRYRIDGELLTMATIDPNKVAQIVGRLKSISNVHQEITDSRDGRIVSYPSYNIRVSSQKNVFGEKFVLRLLKKNQNVKNLFELGFPEDEKLVERAFNKSNSIILISAPTGEGKTTSLYSVVDYLNSPEIDITTIEDPVELRIVGVNQVEISRNISFANSLRTVLRQDPDIILVGEIRDRETGQIAIEAGQTGHLVLSTIHTIDAIETITRLRKFGISDYDISTTLITSISQRLVRRLCEKCKTERKYTNAEIETIKNIERRFNTKFDYENKTTYTAVGCAKCENTGYFDRIALFEILCIDEEIKNMIADGISTLDIKKYAMESVGYAPFVIDGINKVIKGTTTISELKKKLAL